MVELFENTPITINLQIDWMINEFARRLSLKVFWAEPTIVSQQSLAGGMETSIV